MAKIFFHWFYQNTKERLGAPIMDINSINQPFFTKEYAAGEAKSALISGVGSAALTLALNKGQSPKTAGKVGLIAAGVSLAIGAVQRAVALHKINKETKEELSNMMAETADYSKTENTSDSDTTKIASHQG